MYLRRTFRYIGVGELISETNVLIDYHALIDYRVYIG